MSLIRSETAKLIHALDFFWRIRLPRPSGEEPEESIDLASCAHWFPIAGLAVGAIPSAALFVASPFLPSTVAAGIAIAAGILVTGALHEDGLADCADGLGAKREPEEILRVMKDSATGAFGAIALILSVGLRWMALWAVLEASGTLWAILAILAAHGISRAGICNALRFSSCARPEGLGGIVADGIDQERWIPCMGIALAIAILLGGVAGILAGALAMAAGIGFLKFFEERVGGYTGDVLGAMQQIGEITFLIVISGFWGTP